MPKETAGAAPQAPAKEKSEKLRYTDQNFYKGIEPGTEVIVYGFKMKTVDDHTAVGEIPEWAVDNLVENGRMARM